MVLSAVLARHANAACERYPTCIQTLYVRSCGPENQAECDDSNDGVTPQTAWRSLKQAATFANGNLANAGACILVGPGTYNDGNVDLRKSGSFNPQGTSLPIAFLGDASGVCTGDLPGPVIVRPDLAADEPLDTGFLIFGANDVVVSGFEIVGARVAGIQVRPSSFGRSSRRAVIANNVIHDSGDCSDGLCEGRGIEIIDSSETVVFNNLIYRNIGVGIVVRAGEAVASASSDNARIISNTVYGHDIGINVGRGVERASQGAWVINNIVVASESYGIDVNVSSTCDYIGAFNLVTGADNGSFPLRYSPSSPHDPSDLNVDPSFNAADEDDFSLTATSPALDAGSIDATALGLQGTTARTDGAVDVDRVDLGYHRNSVAYPPLAQVPIALQTLYVRSNGNDDNDGSTPARAMRNITRAMRIAPAVARIVVGPGAYDGPVVLNTTIFSPAGPLEFYADATGTLTGDSPGHVVVDGHRRDDTFNIIGRCSTIIDGFTVTGGNDNGIGIKESHRSIVRNNIIFSNVRRGINVVDANDVQILNNLSYKNSGGIQIGGPIGSPRAIVQNNTVYGNSANGILIGTNGIPSADAHLRYNVLASNGERGLQLDDNVSAGVSADGFCSGYNIVFDADPTRRYGPVQDPQCELCLIPITDAGMCAVPMCEPRGEPCPDPPDGCVQQCSLAPPNDRTLDPLFVAPEGADGCIGGRRFQDDDFRLRPGSQATNFSDTDPQSMGLDDRTTRNDDLLDDDAVLDAGFHYLPGSFGTSIPLAADCDADRCVRIDEVIRAVRIALEASPLGLCVGADLDGDNRVAVNELVAAVSDAFCCKQIPE